MNLLLLPLLNNKNLKYKFYHLILIEKLKNSRFKMSHLYGVGINITCKKINLEFKLQLRKRGGIGIRSLKVMFRRFD